VCGLRGGQWGREGLASIYQLLRVSWRPPLWRLGGEALLAGRHGSWLMASCPPGEWSDALLRTTSGPFRRAWELGMPIVLCSPPTTLAGGSCVMLPRPSRGEALAVSVVRIQEAAGRLGPLPSHGDCESPPGFA
jgi:hypothetical protein